VVKKTIPQGQIFSLLTNARSIMIGHLAAGKLNPFYRTIGSFNDPDGLSFRVGAGRFKVSVPVSDCANQQVAGVPFGHISGVQTRIDFYRIPIGNQAGHG
jgi:hypothetical protein